MGRSEDMNGKHVHIELIDTYIYPLNENKSVGPLLLYLSK